MRNIFVLLKIAVVITTFNFGQIRHITTRLTTGIHITPDTILTTQYIPEHARAEDNEHGGKQIPRSGQRLLAL